MNFKFRTKLYVVFSVIVLFAMLSFSLFMQVYIFEQIREETTDNGQQLCVKISENVDTYIEKIDDITKKLISDADLLTIMREIKNGKENLQDYEELKRNRKIADIVTNAITLTSFPHVNVYLYDIDGTFQYVYHQDKSNFEQVIRNKEAMEKLKNKKMVIYSNHGETFKTEDSLSFVRSIFDISANKYGYIEVQSDYKNLEKICNINQTGKVILLGENGEILYPTSGLEKKMQQVIRNYSGKEAQEILKTAQEMYFFSKSDYSGITTCVQYPIDVIYSSLRLLQRTTLIFMAFVTGTAIFLVVIFSRMLVKPLQELRDSVRRVTYGTMELPLNEVDNNEIIELRDAFQKILQDLKLSAQKEIEANQAEASARISALQAQISPHFIHNVLYSISILAKEGRSEDAAIMCKQLSNMLRYTVNSNAHSVYLSEEILCISNYLSLQEKYYEDFLEYKIQMEKELEVLEVPRLSILPFVENVIQHAFDCKKPPYKVFVRCSIRNGKWRIEVEDNGKGFAVSKRIEIEERLQEKKIIYVENRTQENPGLGGMGIVNSLFRLQYYFGESFTYEIQDNKFGGTTIYLSGDVI